MIELEVFPNTGHHFFHVPLKSLAPRKTEEELTRYAHRNRGPWEPWSEFSRSEEYTSELQSLRHLVCRLLLEKKTGLPSTSRSAAGRPAVSRQAPSTTRT